MPRLSLLLLEMDPQLSGALELFLRGRSYRVHAAATPAEAMRAAAVEPVDVVIIGNIPDSLDTATVAQRLRAILAPRQVSVLVLATTIDDIADVDLVVPRHAHPRAILDGLRAIARRRQITGPVPALAS
jgi:DNA-binding response OmpR family regulator